MQKPSRRFLTIIHLILVLAVFLLTLLFGELKESERNDPNILGQTSFINEVEVLEVVDGDTIKVRIDNDKYTVRLIGIDTPETKHPNKPVECFGKEASEYLASILKSQQIQLELDPSQGEQDKYGRLLAYIWLNDNNINRSMLQNGYAFEYTYNTPYKYQIEFKASEFEARLENRGLWDEAKCNY